MRQQVTTREQSEEITRLVGQVMAERIPDDAMTDEQFDAVRDEIVRIVLPAIVLWRPDEDEVDGDEREALASAVGSVLCNAMNFPEPAIVPLLGQDMAPLIEKTTDAVLAAGFRRQVAVTVSRAQVVSLAESYAFDRWPDQTVHDDPELVTEVALPLVAGWLREAGLEVTP